MAKNNPIENLNPKEHIIVKGARVHNLKNINVALKRNKFTVITGLSGSGKSSLAFDTLYAEGQRRYIESLSSYARQFLGKIEKPAVEYIKGVSPAVAIEQKVNTRNPRSTVGTSTEIYDYLKLFFARIGKTYSPISGKEVKRHTVSDVMSFLHKLNIDSKIQLFAPYSLKKDIDLLQQLSFLSQQGFSRIKTNDELLHIEDIKNENQVGKSIWILIDRFVIKHNDEENENRIADSIQTAFYEGNGEIIIEDISSKKTHFFSNKFELDGIQFEEPNAHFFSFNNPVGACKACEGFGSVIGIDHDLVIPDKSLSVYDNAIMCWRGEKMSWYKEQLILNAHKFNFPVHKPIIELSKEEYDLLWKGNKYFTGLNDFFSELEEQSYKIQYRVMLSRYRGKTKCPECKGTRLRKDANYVKIDGKTITDFILMSVDESLVTFKQLNLTDNERKIAKRLIIEIESRLQFLSNVGLGYLTLNRLSSTLSGGESQRINLATSIGSSLVGSMYILDEPSIGLHPRDTQKLISVLQSLKKLGNTVIVVEHDEEIMQSADELIDMGPMAGTQGGEVVFAGNHNDLIKEKNSLTAQYLTNKIAVTKPKKRRNWKKSIKVIGARENNLKNINVEFPLEVFTVITGVSGSGKSTLVKKILYPALKKLQGGYGEQTGIFNRLEGDYKNIQSVEFIDQNPIGKSSRSNPVTYVKAFDEIRNLFASQQLSKLRGYKTAHFSFNVDGGRCEICQGEGEITVEMQFMADIHLTCENCKGKRFKDEILEVKFENKNIDDILSLTIDDAISFFKKAESKSKYCKKIISKLIPLQSVGLGYVQLGQSSSTLSGGEAQRIKLASFLIKGNTTEKNLFIFDEPTTGLHFHDVQKLLDSLNALLELGHSLIVIEHNMDIIKNADWIIDLGPDGGKNGGEIIFEGTPENLINIKESYTAQYLKEKI